MLLFSKNNPTPKELAVITALNNVVVLSLILIVLKLSVNNAIHWWSIPVIAIISFTYNYFAIYDSLKRFIYRKIKLIYKSIHSLKAPKSQPAMKVDMNKHLIDEVKLEVAEWAEDWTAQITTLKQMEEYRREFIGNVSHELKTPIFNILGYLDTLSDGDITDSQLYAKYLQRAINNAERMNTIVADLGYISKFEAGKLQLMLNSFNIVDLTQDVLEDMELKASKKNIQLKFKDQAPTPHLVIADKESVRRVIVNLISNSIKYGKENGETLVSFYDMDTYILIEVSDDGKGIAQEHLSRLFERFYRVDKGRSRDEGGTGLGLAIVKHIIEAHAQTVTVRSRLGEGSTFGFTLQKSK